MAVFAQVGGVASQARDFFSAFELTSFVPTL